MMQSLLDLLFSKEALAAITATLGGLVAKFIVGGIRRRNVALATFHAFHIVEDLAASVTDGGAGDVALDKVLAGLKAANDYMVSNGWRALKPWETELARLNFQSLHGQQQVALRVAHTGASLVLPQAPEDVAGPDLGKS